MQKIFTSKFLAEIGFKKVRLPKSPYNKAGKYGKAKSIKGSGITVIRWNNEGHSCTYFGDKLLPNVSVEVKKDWDTRTAFNGYAYTQDDVRKILSLTW